MVLRFKWAAGGAWHHVLTNCSTRIDRAATPHRSCLSVPEKRIGVKFRPRVIPQLALFCLGNAREEYILLIVNRLYVVNLLLNWAGVTYSFLAF